MLHHRALLHMFRTLSQIFVRGLRISLLTRTLFKITKTTNLLNTCLLDAYLRVFASYRFSPTICRQIERLSRTCVVLNIKVVNASTCIHRVELAQSEHDMYEFHNSDNYTTCILSCLLDRIGCVCGFVSLRLSAEF